MPFENAVMKQQSSIPYLYSINSKNLDNFSK